MPGANQNDPEDKPQTGAEDEADPQLQDDQIESDDQEADDELPEDFDPKKAWQEIKKLRQENAQRRTTNKDLEIKSNTAAAKLERLKQFFGDDEEEVDPEEALEEMTGYVENLEVENSVNHLARIYNIPVEQDEYFRFLLQQKFNSLEEGEEMADEDFDEIISKVNAVSTGSKNAGTGLGGKKPAAGDGGSSGVTLEQFKKMNTLEKSALYTKNQALYNKLVAESMKR